MFDRATSPLDPMITYSPWIRATVYHSDRNGDFENGSQSYCSANSWKIKSLDDAVAALEDAAGRMPTMAAESERIKSAKAKLTDEDRRLLGIRG